MKEADPVFEEPWPDDETRVVIDAVRSAVDGRIGSIGNPLAEAGRRWARAHQSASLMRARLSALEASMDAELGLGSEADRIAYYRAWRTVTDAATWTSLTQLEEAALVDPLTGVGNRRALDLMLTRAISGARRTGSELVVAAVDLDGLKRINDSRGHAEGDRTLTSLVNAFGEKLRASDTVFRTGGDEFAVVLPGMGLGDVDPLMHRISVGATPGFTWGAAALAAEHQHPAELLDAADTDLYRRRGVERESVGAGVAGAAAGPVAVGLRHPNGSTRTRVSRRTAVAAAAAVVAISGTLGAVTTLSPANHAALPSTHPSGPAGHSGGSVVEPPTLPPTSTPTPTTNPPPTTPTTVPVTSGASTSSLQLADVTTTSPASSSVGAATTNPAANAASTATPPTPAPATPAPAAPAPAPAPTAIAPVAAAPSPHKPLPPQASAAAVAAHAKQ